MHPGSQSVPQLKEKMFAVKYYHITYSQTEQEGSAVVVESPGSAYHHYSQAVTQAAWKTNQD